MASNRSARCGHTDYLLPGGVCVVPEHWRCPRACQGEEKGRPGCPRGACGETRRRKVVPERCRANVERRKRKTVASDNSHHREPRPGRDAIDGRARLSLLRPHSAFGSPDAYRHRQICLVANRNCAVSDIEERVLTLTSTPSFCGSLESARTGYAGLGLRRVHASLNACI